MAERNFSLQRNPDGTFSLLSPTPVVSPEIRKVIKKRELSDKMYDPPTTAFLQKLLFDVLQRGNFMSAIMFRQQRDELHKRLEQRLPELQTDPAVKDSFSEALRKSQIYKEEIDKMGIGAFEALTDFVLRRDTEGAESVWIGISGQEKLTYGDLAADVGIPRLVGLVLDMGLSPENYLPFGLIFKGAKKGLRALPWVKRGMDAIRKTAFTKLMGKLFVPGAGLPKEYNMLEAFTKRAGAAEDVALLKRFKGLWNKVHGNKDEIAKLMTHVKQHPTDLKSLGPANQKIFKEIAGEIDEIGKTLVTRRYIPYSSYKKWKDTYMYTYYPRYTKQLSGRLPQTKYGRMLDPSFVRPKHFANIEEVVDFGKQLDAFKDIASKDEALEIAKGLRQVADQPGNIEKAIQVLDDVEDIKSYAKALQLSHAPEQNFFKLTVSYVTEFNHLLRRDRFMGQVIEEFGQKVPNVFDAGIAPAGKRLFLPRGQLRFFSDKRALKIVDKYFPAGLEGADEMIEITPQIQNMLGEITALGKKQLGVTRTVSAFLMDEGIVKRLNKVSTGFFGDPATNQLIHVFDKWRQLWMGMATAVRLPFHLRNAYSNTFLLYAADVNPAMIPIRYAQAIAIATGKKPKIVTQAGKIVSIPQLKEMMEKLGVAVGWMRADRAGTWKEMAHFSKYGKLRTGLNPIEWGRKLGGLIEDQARVALFIDRVAKGDDYRTAALRVFEGLYDYVPGIALTDFERNVMKRMIPFYTWIRKNAPNMIHTLFTKPQKFANTGKVFRMFYDMAPETREERMLKPEFMDRNMWMKAPDWIPRKMGQEGPVYYHLDLPLGELTPDMQHWIGMVNPLALKGLAEAAFDIKTFPKMGMPVEKFKGEMVPMPWMIAYTPGIIQKLLKVDAYKDRKTGLWVMGMPARYRHALYSLIPALAEGAKLHPQPLPLEQAKTPWRAITYATGIGIMPVDKKQAAAFWDWDRKGRIKELQRFVMQFGRSPTYEEMEQLKKELFGE